MTHNVDTEIQFSGLKSGIYSYDFMLDNSFFSEWKNEKILGGEVVFNVKMEKKERLLIFFFNFSGKVQTKCDRCLGEMEWPVEGEQTLYVKFSDTEQSDEEDVVFLPEKESKIDLGQWMYEYVAVEMPIQCIHPDDEEGNPLCDPEMLKFMTPVENESKNSETDPRWDALKALKD